jgi:hypothetical protein
MVKGRNKKNGRADLFVRYFDDTDSKVILLESKYSECSAFCREEGWDVHWEKGALLKQAIEYAQNEEAIPDYVGSLCFLPIYYNCTKEKEFKDVFNNWLSLTNFPTDEGYFYCIVKLEDNKSDIGKDKEKEYAYPFIRITGILKPYEK